MSDAPADPLDTAILAALLQGRHGDPFALLGPRQENHGEGTRTRIRACLPGAAHAWVECGGTRMAMTKLGRNDVFSLLLPTAVDAAWRTSQLPGARRYDLTVAWSDGSQQRGPDPYAFATLLGDMDLHLFGEGRHFELAQALGAQAMSVDGVPGVRFAVWAPNASAVAVLGDFNGWHAARHPMRLRHGAGVWELFVPGAWGARPGCRYKFAVRDVYGELLPDKADPLARMTEMPPATASVITRPGETAPPFAWHDAAWMQRRAAQDPHAEPLLIYEVHAGAWQRAADGGTLSWDALGDRLIPYLQDLGFTHLELLPITEHPFGGSWGYQPLSLFAPSARFGPPQAFARFVDRCHAANLGVILDWVPAHFPTDPHGLARFDGTALYEHADPREGLHQDWNTLIYNLGRNEVRGFLLASALHWLEHFHIDGLRVDAVASMLYRDYSRAPNAWIPNRHGGRENLEAIDFLRTLNTEVQARCPGAMTIAEESTAWPGVTAPTDSGGLGFTFKWNMGWMHDTLRYMAHDPVHRTWHHHNMTFGLVYAWSEAFVLPLSHDEVVHGKGSLLGKMPGDTWQRFANLRAYLAFMWAHPGKKLLFMGGELAQEREWNHDTALDWQLLDMPAHAGVQSLVRDLNRLYAQLPALHRLDAVQEGFRWVVGDDSHNSVLAFLRLAAANEAPVLAISNLTPVPRPGYRVGVPQAGPWQERLNTDAACYGGSNLGNQGGAQAVAQPSHGWPASLTLTLPPLATLILTPA
ncbi:1,4-alpha-glucan branching protein GlgB [Imbroritus primus]|uniref:1,4-alpha-glucan branching protein GlgB n=1 Tax=Imbroritus primus TaxID=3058603 RepID=A0ACD3SNF6_9BURK|nr:1,4-alpha-glucan branching protein GlgB [Burkholderiaceae bacterium PBA]